MVMGDLASAHVPVERWPGWRIPANAESALIQLGEQALY